MATELEALTKWPTQADGMNVDLLLRVIGVDTQREWLRKWEDLEATSEHFKSPLYHTRTMGIISAVGLMACLRALREADPVRAEAFAREYWGMCDAGDSFGELLWVFSQEAGLDLELVKPDGVADSTASTDSK